MKNQLINASIWGATATFSLPVNADIIPGQFVPDPGRPDWNGVNVRYDNSDQQVLGGAGPEIIYDRPVTGYTPVIAASSYVNWQGAPKNFYVAGLYSSNRNGNNNGNNQQNGGNGNGNNGCGNGNGGPNGDKNCGGPKPPKPPVPQPDVPGPLPVLGLAAAFGFSRKLRKRIRN